MLRRLSLVAVATLLALAAWFAFRTPERAADPVARVEIAPTGSEAWIEGLHESLEQAQGLTQRTSAATEESEDEYDGPQLVVVDARTGHARPAARVFWLDEDRLQRALADPVARLSGEPEQLHFQHGIELTTGASGGVRLPVSDQRALVYCRVEDDAGKLWIEPAWRSDLRLELVRARELFVRVLDAEGRGVEGVPVALFSTLHGWIDGTTHSLSTGPDGLTRLKRAAAHIVAAPEEQVFAVGVRGQGEGLPRVLVDRLPDEAHPLELRGHWSLLRVTVNLGLHGVPVGVIRAEGPAVIGAEGIRRRTIGWDSGPTATFALVRLPGRLTVAADLTRPHLMLTATFDDRGWNYGSDRIVKLPGPSQTIVCARAIDSGGKRMEPGLVTLRHCGQQADSSERPLTTGSIDSNGYLYFVATTAESMPNQRSFVLTHEARTARIDLPERLQHPIQDLGEVRFSTSRLLARGRVLLADGTPASHGRVHIEVLGAATSSSSDCDRWSVTIHRQGTFEIVGAVSGPRVRLRAEWPLGCCSEPLDVAVGSEDVELRFGIRGAIEGSLELPEGVREGRFTLELEADPSIGRGPPHEVQLESSGAFRIMEVCLGSYDLVVGERDSGKTLRIEGLVLRSNETLHDARLQSIRVTELLR